MSQDTEVVGRRIAAQLLDILILALVFTLAGALLGNTEAGDTASARLRGTNALVFFGIVLLYYFISEAASGQTLGKRMAGIKVVALDGREVGTRAAAIRTILRIIDSLPFLYLVGMVFVVTSKRRQRLGDMAARTLVVRVRDR